jgi:3-dehydrosphinganine reductase
LQEAAAQLVESGVDPSNVETAALNVTDEPALSLWAAGLVQRRGAPSMLVTSAGIAKPDYFNALSQHDFRAAMEVNYFGSLHAVRAFAPSMLAVASGAVVLLSSGAGLVGIFGYAAYAPTKFAVRGLAEVLRAEFRAKGVTVHVVCPPDTDTPQLAQENLTKPRETRAISGQSRVLSADAVAGEIVEGVRRGRFMIAPGADMKLLGALHSVLAPVLRFMFDRAAARAAKSRLPHS